VCRRERWICSVSIYWQREKCLFSEELMLWAAKTQMAERLNNVEKRLGRVEANLKGFACCDH
jgi:hypothetical protein